MRRRSTWALVVLAACKAQVAGVPTDGTADDVDSADAVLDAPPAPPSDGPIKLGKWGAPVKLGVASSAQVEDDVTLSANTLELFFAINGANGKDLFVTTRPAVGGAWTPPDALPFNTAMFSEETPRLSADDKTLYFATNRGGTGALDIYKTTRAAPGMNVWSMPQVVMSVSTGAGAEKWFMPCGTDHFIMVRSVGTGDSDLVEGTIGGPAPAPITELNSTGNETGTFVSPDCLSIYFASTRVTPTKLYHSQRAAITMPWDAPSPVNDFPITGGDGNQEDPWMSSDSRTFAFVSDAGEPGNKDVYLSTR